MAQPIQSDQKTKNDLEKKTTTTRNGQGTLRHLAHEQKRINLLPTNKLYSNPSKPHPDQEQLSLLLNEPTLPSYVQFLRKLIP